MTSEVIPSPLPSKGMVSDELRVSGISGRIHEMEMRNSAGCRLPAGVRREALAYLLHLSRQQIVNQRLIGNPPLLCDRL